MLCIIDVILPEVLGKCIILTTFSGNFFGGDPPTLSLSERVLCHSSRIHPNSARRSNALRPQIFTKISQSRLNVFYHYTTECLFASLLIESYISQEHSSSLSFRDKLQLIVYSCLDFWNDFLYFVWHYDNFGNDLVRGYAFLCLNGKAFNLHTY